MLKENATFFRRLMIGIDIGIATGTFIAGYFLRDRLDGLYRLSQYSWIFFLFVISWVFFLYILGVYDSFRLKSIREISVAIIKAGGLSFLVFTGVNYLFQLSYISRLFIMFIFVLSTSALILKKILLYFFMRQIRRRGLNFRNVLIVGTGRRAQKVIREINQQKELGLKIIGLIDMEETLKHSRIEGYTVLGTLADLPRLLKENAVDHVMFIVPHSWLSRLQDALLYCETVGVSLSIAVDYFEARFASATQSLMFGLPFLSFQTTPVRVLDLAIKRLIDILISFMALAVVCPLMLVVGILIKVTSPGPVFFRQKRKGLNGRVFTLYKFRTMRDDAEQMIDELKRYNEMSGPVFKMANDPRVTSIGRFLRKISIDEIPQLWNVLRGDMSLVGPRPPLVNEVEQYDPWHRRRLSMRPGITCLWQIRGRNKITDFNDWIRMDLEYIDNWSLWQDFKILIMTVPVVVFGVGAK